MPSTKRVRPAAFAVLALFALAACGDDNPADPGNGNGNGNGTTTVTFVWPAPDAAPTVTSVHVAGSFNEWDTEALPMSQLGDGTWQATQELEPGTYEYKFVFNGGTWSTDMCNDPTWGDPASGGKVDPQVESCVDDEHGGMNAEIVVE